jgi:hypothetical protein
MMYASSKDAIRKQLVGISAEIQATSFDEITFESGTHLFRSVCLQIAVTYPYSVLSPSYGPCRSSINQMTSNAF